MKPASSNITRHEQAAYSTPEPRTTRLRHELRKRELTVVSKRQLSPHFIRLVLSGPELADFASAGADDHVKIFLPAGNEAQPTRRDYTPRWYSADREELALDFVIHPGGPAAEWANGARVGDSLVVGGPRGSQVIDPAIRNWLLIGDETALPAIARRIEEGAAEQHFTAVVAVPGSSDEQLFATSSTVDTHWVHRPPGNADKADALLAALESLTIRPDTFVWIAGETTVMKTLRAYLTAQRAVPAKWIKAAGYWRRGREDGGEKL